MREAATFRKRPAKFPSDDALWRALGVVEEKLGNISAAIAAHQKATELNQNHPSSYIELAESCVMRGGLKRRMLS